MLGLKTRVFLSTNLRYETILGSRQKPPEKEIMQIFAEKNEETSLADFGFLKIRNDIFSWWIAGWFVGCWTLWYS